MSAAPPELQRVSVLMARTGLGLGDLGSTLATRFVGGLSITERDQCKTSQMRLSPQPNRRTWRACIALCGCTASCQAGAWRLLDSALVQFNASNPAPTRC